MKSETIRTLVCKCYKDKPVLDQRNIKAHWRSVGGGFFLGEPYRNLDIECLKCKKTYSIFYRIGREKQEV